MLSNEEIITSVVKAFSPMYCTAEISDYTAKLQYRVSDYNKKVVRSGEVALHHAQDKELLDCVLRQVRDRIQSKGHILN